MSDYKKLAEYLDSLDITGNEIGEFEGGGDSGGFNFHKLISPEMEALLYDLCERAIRSIELGHSWYDGNVSTAGAVYYYPNTKTIVLEGDSEDNGNLILDSTIELNFNLPEHFHFDSISLHYGNEDITLLRINITSGFITKEMEDWANNIIKEIDKALDDVYYPNLYYFDDYILKKDLTKPHSIQISIGSHSKIYQEINLLDEY